MALNRYGSWGAVWYEISLSYVAKPHESEDGEEERDRILPGELPLQLEDVTGPPGPRPETAAATNDFCIIHIYNAPFRLVHRRVKDNSLCPTR